MPPPVPPRERRSRENHYSREPTFSRASRDENQSFLPSPMDESTVLMMTHQRRGRKSENYSEHVNQQMNRPSTPIPAPRKILTRTTYKNLNDIEYQDYFFGKDMQIEMQEKFDAGRDGSYCVRESTKQAGTYVLDIKINGKKKSMKILNSEDNYYFQDSFPFPSILHLIDYYQNHSLIDVNPILDLKLCYPLSRSTTENVDGMFQKIDGNTKEILTKFSALIEDYNLCLRESDRINDGIESLKDRLVRQQQIQNACQSTINWLKKTIQTCNNYDTNHMSCKERNVLDENIIRQEKTMDEITRKKNEVMVAIEEVKNDLNWYGKQTLENENKLNKLNQQQECFETNLRQQGVSQYLINSIRENGSKVFDEWELYNSYLNRDQWYFPQYNSDEAKEALKNCVSGTFLIRSTTYGKLGLSVKVKDAVLKCIIERTVNGYGFSEPYDHFQSLEDFVLYYARNNLSFHNQDLDTVLKYPYKYFINNRDEIFEIENCDN